MQATDHGYEWATTPLYRDGTDVRVGTVIEFDDEPLAVYYDKAHEEPDLLVFEYDTTTVSYRCEHAVARALADDADRYIPTAVVVTPRATEDEVAALHSRLHAGLWDDAPDADPEAR